ALIGPHLLEHHWPKRGERRSLRRAGPSGSTNCRSDQRRARRPRRSLAFRSNLVFGTTRSGSGTMMQSCASSAELRRAGPFYNSGTKAMGGSGTPPPRIVIDNVSPESGRSELAFFWYLLCSLIFARFTR